ncbi:MAG TPA: glycosyltransferase family 2 protein [Candidatus Methylacidiphilales bacterium]|jgi:glycosyltransferase involved in cell wall biosynthesis|nr:glycosyltransferase family 2 protein [Candidatus Methylacidiphilales bacterium]
MTPLPRITVVTPSFNQAPFLRDTIESVLGQGYPDLEYIIMDGGSTDGSAEIIKEYAPRLTYWQSAKDGGQAAAINAGFARATGSILAWLNSDDYYLPGTLRAVAELLDPARAGLLLGNCLHVHEEKWRVRGSDVPLRHRQMRLATTDYIIQPSSFWTKAAWDKVGTLDEKLQYVFDWDWFIRCVEAGVEITTTPRYFAAYRIHAGHKSGTGAGKRNEEVREIYTRHSPPHILKLHDDYWSHMLRVVRVRKWIRNLRVNRMVPTERLLKWFLPDIFGRVPEQDIRDYLGLINDRPRSRKNP